MYRLARFASLALLPLTLSVTSFSGCDLFRPATPETPSGSQAVIDENFSTPESTLATMQRAVAAISKASAVASYMRCLVDPEHDGRTFIAVFDPAALAADGRTVAPPWDNAHEQLFFSTFISLYNGADSLAFEIIDQDPDSLGTTQTLLVRHYSVWNIPKDRAQASFSFATGIARLEFVKLVDGRWVLQSWADTVDPVVGAKPADLLNYSFSHYRVTYGGN